MRKTELAMSMDIEIGSNEIKMQNVVIPNMTLLLDGGVYLFVLDGLPIYVGEANVFSSRITDHLMTLKEQPEYFGFQNLVGVHKLKYFILRSGLPYKAYKKEGRKRSSDKNREERRRLESKFIEEYQPIVQRPRTNEKYPRSRKSDGMITDGDIKGKFVSQFVKDPSPYKLIQ